MAPSVFPDADLKFFIIADRARALSGSGSSRRGTRADLEELNARSPADRLTPPRGDPLRKAAGAIEIDTPPFDRGTMNQVVTMCARGWGRVRFMNVPSIRARASAGRGADVDIRGGMRESPELYSLGPVIHNPKNRTAPSLGLETITHEDFAAGRQAVLSGDGEPARPTALPGPRIKLIDRDLPGGDEGAGADQEVPGPRFRSSSSAKDHAGGRARGHAAASDRHQVGEIASVGCRGRRSSFPDHDGPARTFPRSRESSGKIKEFEVGRYSPHRVHAKDTICGQVRDATEAEESPATT